MLQYTKDASEGLPEHLQRSQVELPALLGALDNLSTYVYTKDLDGRYTYANQLSCALWGLPLQEIIGKTDSELFAPDHCAKLLATDQRVLTTGAPVALEECHLLRPWNKPRSFWSVKAPLRDEEGRIIGLFGISTDISGHKRAEQRLSERDDDVRRQLNEIQTYYDTAPIGLAVLDTELRYLRINKRLAESNGYPVAAHLGRRLHEMAPHLAASLAPKLKQVIATGEPLLNQEFQFQRDGRDSPVVVHLDHYYPLRREDGEIYGINVVVEDISERRAMEQKIREFNASLERKVEARTAELEAVNTALQESEQKYHRLFDSAGDAIAIIDLDGNFLDVNPAVCSRYGYDRETFLTMNVADLDVPEEVHEIEQRIRRIQEQGEYVFEARHHTADGRILMVEIKGVEIRIGERPCLFGIWRDITERKRAEMLLRESHQRVSDLLDAMAAAVYVTDMKTYELVFMNETAKSVWGDGSGRQCYEVLYGLEAPCSFCTNDKLIDASGEPCGVHGWDHFNPRSQRWYALRDRAVRWSDGRLVRVEIATDITAYKEAQAYIERLAYYDSLTGLPNRIQLVDLLGRITDDSLEPPSLLAVCYLNLDEFKTINDRDGRDFGDAVLVALAQRLLRGMRQGDYVARLGSDEFALILTDMSSTVEALNTVQAILRQVGRALEVAGQRLFLSASLGLTLFPVDRAGPDALLQHAHEALFQAKRRRKGCYYLYDPIRDHQAQQRRHLYQEFVNALAKDQLRLHYQPKIRLADGRLHGLEALIRWQHPEKGLLRPDQFLPLIEGSPLEQALGEWVIHRALAQQQCWRDQGQELLISVNISPRQLQEPNFSIFLARALDKHSQGAAVRLEIEVLEIAELDDVGVAAEVMRACKQLGVSFSLDDFGTGYASLTYFQQLPIDIIKIDRRFVLGMLDNPDDRAIVEGVLLMARTLPRPVLAEGVESPQIGQLLRQMGCDYGQGYGIARPMPAEQVLPWLSDWANGQRWCPPAAQALP